MDEQLVRSQLDGLRKELARNEAEHEILLNLLKGFEGWLRLHSIPTGKYTPQLAVPIEPTESGSSNRGEVSLRGAVMQVLREARGEPLRSEEIWSRVQAMGGRTTVEDPTKLVDALAHSLRRSVGQIRRIGPRTWQWIGSAVEKTADGTDDDT